MKLVLPLSYEDIPLKHLVKHGQKELNDYELVKLYGEYSDEFVRSLPQKLIEEGAKQVKKCLNEVVNKHYPIIEIEGKEYGFIPDWGEFSGGEYIDITKALETPIVSACHIMSILYRPITRKVGDKYEIEPYTKQKPELFHQCSAALYSGAMVFFYNIKKESLKTSLNSLEKELQRNWGRSTVGIKRFSTWLGKILQRFKKWLRFR